MFDDIIGIWMNSSVKANTYNIFPFAKVGSNSASLACNGVLLEEHICENQRTSRSQKDHLNKLFSDSHSSACGRLAMLWSLC